MPLLQVVLGLAVIGAGLWLLFKYVPLAPPFRQLITAVVVFVVVIWLLNVFGLMNYVTTVRTH